MRGFLGGDERARQPVGHRAAAADLDSEGDGQVDRQAGDPRRVAEQCVERFEMVAERLPRILEPGENAGVALVEHAIGEPDRQTSDDLFDQLAFAVRRQCREDLLKS